MIFNNGDIIDNKFRVDGLCNDSGGMGQILFVTDITVTNSNNLVLKYCRSEDEEIIARFKREVRLLDLFNGSSKVIQKYFSNTDINPPYFVMPYYSQGSLLNLIPLSIDQQEIIFFQMLDCIEELHSNNVFHRDIKPHNFLYDDSKNVIVSDLGLGVEPNSASRFTHSRDAFGTDGYFPPEFLNNQGFKYFDQKSDIFMLGKSFYVLLTGRDPSYISLESLAPGLQFCINKACNPNPNYRFSSIADFKQALKQAYDVLLERSGPLGIVQGLIKKAEEKLENEKIYNSQEITDIIRKLSVLGAEDRNYILINLSSGFMHVVSMLQDVIIVNEFLNIYQTFVESYNYSFSFAENIATSMSYIVQSNISSSTSAHALKLAITAAVDMNRYAAMDTCKSIITSIKSNNDDLANNIIAILPEFNDTFIKDIEPYQCNNEIIANYLRVIRNH